DLRWILPAGLGEVRPSAAAATNNRREFLDDAPGLQPRRQIFRHRNNQADLAVVLGRQRDDAAADTIAQRIRTAAKGALLETGDAFGEELDPVNVDWLVSRRTLARGSAQRYFHFQLVHLSRESLRFRLKLLNRFERMI